ncbi:exopolysaccharide biosynthesis protein [Clostridium carboxidivorans P7]|uniref:protein-tyrosine-phosphatase n=1 Tax=Clostridium carboxidivorans P7 TaxID=536227 RepID=C6PXX1_9CLOT|nr:CpsB/CapC family capsule biosynthesis tyrosine phosphatase [Clostridium carboxidivorans]AKN31965.1 exopolysaccharide biosynthesis protein [Clostridium carboxidivorans P7]EET85909.1 Protein-tyrosine-phosphatase [Clostridium carboxidivorans P7]EFG87899.1 putative capsular polysaccharide biosynthesis protein [Clostridium carboxidivorans P7]
MIDIHSHILPGIDDGAETIEDTMEMLKIADKDGIKKIVASPHFCSEYHENTYKNICKLVEEINVRRKQQNITVEIFPGQEIFVDNHMLSNYKKGVIKGINNSRYMLVELPMEKFQKSSMDILYEIKLQGMVPVIAHPERYMYFIEKPFLINDFIEEEFLFQVNSGSITGLFGKKVQKLTKILIEHNIVDFIASDAHSTVNRCPEIDKALWEAHKIGDGIRRKVIKNAWLLLQNGNIENQGDKIREDKGIFSFFKRGKE